MPDTLLRLRVPEAALTPENMAALKQVVNYQDTTLDDEGNEISNPVSLKQAVTEWLRSMLIRRVRAARQQMMDDPVPFEANPD